MIVNCMVIILVSKVATNAIECSTSVALIHLLKKRLSSVVTLGIVLNATRR